MIYLKWFSQKGEATHPMACTQASRPVCSIPRCCFQPEERTNQWKEKDSNSIIFSGRQFAATKSRGISLTSSICVTKLQTLQPWDPPFIMAPCSGLVLLLGIGGPTSHANVLGAQGLAALLSSTASISRVNKTAPSAPWSMLKS